MSKKIIIVILASFISLLISRFSNNYQNLIWGGFPFSTIINNINNILAFLYPLFHFIFIVFTTKLTLSLFEIKIPHKKLISATDFSYLAILLQLSFFLYNLVSFESSILGIVNESDIYTVKFLFGLTFYDFSLISIISYYLMLGILVILLWRYNHKKQLLFILISVSMPSVLIIFIQFVFSVC